MKNSIREFEEAMSDWPMTHTATGFLPFYPINDVATYVVGVYSFDEDFQLTQGMIEEKFSSEHGWVKRSHFRGDTSVPTYYCTEHIEGKYGIQTPGIVVTIHEKELHVRIDGYNEFLFFFYTIPEHCFP